MGRGDAACEDVERFGLEPEDLDERWRSQLIITLASGDLDDGLVGLLVRHRADSEIVDAFIEGYLGKSSGDHLVDCWCSVALFPPPQSIKTMRKEFHDELRTALREDLETVSSAHDPVDAVKLIASQQCAYGAAGVIASEISASADFLEQLCRGFPQLQKQIVETSDWRRRLPTFPHLWSQLERVFLEEFSHTETRALTLRARLLCEAWPEACRRYLAGATARAARSGAPELRHEALLSRFLPQPQEDISSLPF